MLKNNSHSFAGLPVALVDELLAKSVQTAQATYEAFHEIINKRDSMRKQLQESTGIHNDSTAEGKEPLTTCGIDGFYSQEKLLTTDSVCCAAFAVEGLTPSSGKRHWKEPAHDEFFHTEDGHNGTSAVLKAVMMEMEVDLAAQAPHDIVLLKGSLITQLLSMMETLKYALQAKEQVSSKTFLNRFKTSILSLKTLFDSSGSAKLIAGIPKESTCNELVNRLDVPHHCDDRVLFTSMLSPGEYTEPLKIDESGLSNVKNIPIKDEKFAEVRDSLVASLSQLHFMYYRPYRWVPAYRIEIDRSIAENSSRLAQLLNSFKYQCSTAGIIEPYPLYSAGRMIKNLRQAIPSFHNSALSHIIKTHKDDAGELFSLLMFQESDMGDTDG